MKKRDLHPALQMTSACNKRCAACLRPPDEKNHAITARTFGLYCDDLRRVSPSREIKYQFATGGEPSLWRDGGMDIVDALAGFHDLGFIEAITMPTNGKNFEDMGYAREFIRRLSVRIDRPVVIGVSIAKYQKNLGAGGYIALDNILSICGVPGARVLPIILSTLSVEDDTYEVLDRVYPGVYKRVTALAPLGVASRARSDCPSLMLAGSDKSTLGAFLPHFMADVTVKIGISADEFSTMPNAEVIDRLSLFSHCGDSPFIDDRWHYCLPFRDDRRFDLCGIGSMREDTIDTFLTAHPAIDELRRIGIVSFARKHRKELSAETADRLNAILSGDVAVPVAYRGCMLCSELMRIGVMDELLFST